MQGASANIGMYDVAGRLVSRHEIMMNGIAAIPAPVATGVYIVRVQSGNKTFVGKVVVR
jgi:hypothetical protein